MTLDIWVNEDYINYMSTRPELIDEMYKIINWKKIDERLVAALSVKEAAVAVSN